MKNFLLPICLFLSTVVFAQDPINYLQNEIILQFRSPPGIDFSNVKQNDQFNHRSLDALNKRLDMASFDLIGNVKERKTFLIRFRSDQDITTLINLYNTLDLFEYVEPNFIGSGAGQKGSLELFPDDPHFSRQYGLYNDGSFTLSPAKFDADIDMELAWDISQGDESIIVAVLDSGLKLDHPEFEGRIWENLG